MDKFQAHLKAASAFGADSLWEFSRKELDEAELLSLETRLSKADREFCAKRLIVERGGLERRQANYERAIEILEHGLIQFGNGDLDHIEMLGELGVAYMRQDAFANASQTFDKMYQMSRYVATLGARKLGREGRFLEWRAEALACKAVKYRGIATYAQAVPSFEDWEAYDEQAVHYAIDLLNESVERADYLLREIAEEEPERIPDFRRNTCKSIATDRLTFCYGVLKNEKLALACAQRTISMSHEYGSTLQAFSRFYAGVVSARFGRITEAVNLWQATGRNDRCTSVIAVCMEPSTETIGYLKELVKYGVKFDHYDEQGYSPLCYVTMGNSDVMQGLVCTGLRNEFRKSRINDKALSESEVQVRVDRRRVEAMRRKEYRAIFQKSFRPLLRIGSEVLARQEETALCPIKEQATNATDTIHKIRLEYARLLLASEKTASTFDHFKFIRYSDFKLLDKLPQPNNLEDMKAVSHLVQTYYGDLGSSHIKIWETFRLL